MKLVLIPYAILTFIIPTSSLQADTIHVPADQPTIQAGIDAAANGDTVLVADGTYTGEGNRDIDFLGKAITVRSENGPEKCIVDCEGLPYHRGFYFFRSEGSGSVLEGFTIRGGWAAGPLSSGGGILCGGASPLIRENIISDNRAAGDASDDGGGGIACFNSAAIISDNVLESNTATPNGGGILCAWNSSVTISGNTVENNVAQVGAGGGISVIESSAAIYDNIIRFNVAPNGNGDGINCAECEIDISNNLIAEQPGGAIYIYDRTRFPLLEHLARQYVGYRLRPELAFDHRKPDQRPLGRRHLIQHLRTRSSGQHNLQQRGFRDQVQIRLTIDPRQHDLRQHRWRNRHAIR